MKCIWKFEVLVDDSFQEIEIPAGARIVHVECQGTINVVAFWAEFNATPKLLHEMRVFRVYGTGAVISGQDMAYVGSAVTAGGALVWHLYEREIVRGDDEEYGG